MIRPMLAPLQHWISGQRAKRILCLYWYMGMVMSAPLLASKLSVTIRDQDGHAVPARVYLTDSEGRSIFPANTIVYDKTSADGISEKHFVPRHGSFSVNLAAGSYRLVVERGKEYVPVEIPLTMQDSDSVRTVKLRRWVNMPSLGWFSADMHVHRPLSDLPTLMEAEDLSVAIPITRWKTMQDMHEDPSLQHYLSVADRDGVFHFNGNHFFPVLNEEVEPRASALLASFLGKQGVELNYPLSNFGQSVLAHNGISDSEKPTSLELPALAALGACETVGLANNHLWRSGSYAKSWGAWPDRVLDEYPLTCRGFVQAGFDIYAALLNMGFPLKLSAGSASGVHPVPPGWSRIYVHSRLPLTPETWRAALKQGRSFVTTGPMLFLDVNGKEPGEDVSGEQFPLRVRANVEMLSLTPVSEAEVVLNGVPHRVALSPDPSKPYKYKGAIEMIIETSTWIAARWSATTAGGGCGSAHTGPVYFWAGDRPIPLNRKQALLFLDRVDGLINQVSKGDSSGDIVINSEELREETLRDFKRARDVYQRLADQTQ